MDRQDTPKYMAIKRRLTEEIRSGRLADGACLPGEVELSRFFQASRGTVRNALSALRRDGLVESSQGRKSMIRNLFKETRPARFLWVGRRSQEHEEPARAPVYNALVRLSEASRTTLTYWMMHGGNDDRWLAEHLHEYDGIVLADIGSSELLPELARKLRDFGNSIGTQERGDNLARIICHTDDNAAGAVAAEFLYRQGISRVALLGVSPGMNSDSFSRDCGRRFDGFLKTAMRLGMGRSYFPGVFSNSANDVADPVPLLESLKLRENRIQALWCMSDSYALKCIDALRRLGFRVPDEVSVMGCDGIDTGALSPVPLTTVGHPFQAIAERIYRLLTDGIGKEASCRTVAITPELIVRHSVKIINQP